MQVWMRMTISVTMPYSRISMELSPRAYSNIPFSSFQTSPCAVLPKVGISDSHPTPKVKKKYQKSSWDPRYSSPRPIRPRRRQPNPIRPKDIFVAQSPRIKISPTDSSHRHARKAIPQSRRGSRKIPDFTRPGNACTLRRKRIHARFGVPAAQYSRSAISCLLDGWDDSKQ